MINTCLLSTHNSSSKASQDSTSIQTGYTTATEIRATATAATAMHMGGRTCSTVSSETVLETVLALGKVATDMLAAAAGTDTTTAMDTATATDTGKQKEDKHYTKWPKNSTVSNSNSSMGMAAGVGVQGVAAAAVMWAA
jgi:hypothetical protein